MFNLCNEFNSNQNRDTAVEILNLLFSYRRTLTSTNEVSHSCEECNHPHLEKIRAFMANNKPIHFVLPAFPAKSPNMNKVLGKLPDKGEQISLHMLNNLCDLIKTYHTPGAKLTICSDGHVFADIVYVPDDDVDAYNQEIAEIIDRDQLGNLNMFGLWNIFNQTSSEEMRKQFIAECTQSYDEIKHIIKSTPRELAMFNGISKFLLEDFLYLEPTKSKSFLRKKIHELTYSVIQRSHGWSDVLESCFPDAIRLSIHPQPCHYKKLGIYLVESKNNWLTPWHGVAVLKKGKFELMKKYEAIQHDAKIVMEFGRPSYIFVSN